MARKGKRKKADSGLVTALGLMRFYEEVEEKVQVPPWSVVVAAFVLSVIAAALDLILRAAR